MKNRICLMAVVGAVIESFLPLYAENKTGLQTPYVWMRTSSVSSDPDNNYFWKDLNGNNVKLNLNEQERVNGRSDIYTYNFYPSFPFTDDANSLLRIEGTGLQKATVIGVYGYSSEDDHTEDGFVLNMSNGTDDDEGNPIAIGSVGDGCTLHLCANRTGIGDNGVLLFLRADELIAAGHPAQLGVTGIFCFGSGKSRIHQRLICREGDHIHAGHLADGTTPEPQVEIVVDGIPADHQIANVQLRAQGAGDAGIDDVGNMKAVA